MELARLHVPARLPPQRVVRAMVPPASSTRPILGYRRPAHIAPHHTSSTAAARNCVVKVARSSRRGNSPQRMRSSYLRKDIYRLDNCNPSQAQSLAPEAASLAPAATALAPDATALNPAAAAATSSSTSSGTATAGSTGASAAAAGQADSAKGPGSKCRATAVVVGAGPAGVTAALYLASNGYRVHVLERRGHPAAMEADKKRTYLIGLGERGLKALDGLDLQVPLSVGRPMRGSVYAYTSGKRIEDPFTPDTRIVGVDRQGLAAFLVNEAYARHPLDITFHWHAQPEAFDLQGRSLRCKTSNTRTTHGGARSGPLELQYDLLIGADGSGSAVRDALAAAVPSFKVEQLTSPVAEMEYKAFHNLPWNEGIRQLLPSYAAGLGAHAANGAAAAAGTAGSADPGMTFFAFNNPQPNQPSPGSITLYLNAGGTWSGTLYQPPGKFEAMAGDAAAHEGAIRMFTPEAFPPSWVPLMAQQMAGVKPSRISPMNLVSHLAEPSLGVVLLGDAGHNVTPQMGQGCNSALEDARMLAAALQQSGHDLAAGLSAFEKQRMPQVHALQRMEEENSWVRRPPNLLKDPLPKTLARVAWISFFMLLPLLRLLPGMKRAVHASLFQTIMSTTIPYNRLQTAIRVAPFVWAGIVAAVVVGSKQLVRVAMGLLA